MNPKDIFVSARLKAAGYIQNPNTVRFDSRRPIDPSMHALVGGLTGGIGSAIVGGADSHSGIQGLRMGARTSAEGLGAGALMAILGAGAGSVIGGEDDSKRRQLVALLGTLGYLGGSVAGGAHGAYRSAQNYNEREFGITDNEDAKDENALGRVEERREKRLKEQEDKD